MKAVSTTVSLPAEEIEAARLDIQRLVEEHGLHALALIGLSAIVPVDELRESARSILREAPFLALVSQTMIGNGQILGRQQTSEENENAETVRHCLRNLDLGTMQMSWAFSHLAQIGSLNSEALSNYVNECNIIQPWRRELLSVAMEHYLRHDFAAFIYLIVFQLEGILRDILWALEYATTKRAEKNGATVTHKLTLDSLLRHPGLVSGLGEDVLFAFRAVLTDEYGWNLRHSLAHALVRPEALGERVALALWLLLCQLLNLRLKPEAD